MVSYPLLSATQQHNLPELIQVSALPAMYEDSTHQLWHCDTVDGEMMLKVCNADNVKNSSFWQGMKSLFDVDLTQSLGQFNQVYQQLSQLSSLVVPEFIAADCASKPSSPAFILTQFELGTMVDSKQVNNDMIMSLAEHISQCHQCENTQWGELYNAKKSADEWGYKLHSTLMLLAKSQNIPSEILGDIGNQTKLISSEKFVPVMIDLRWDQFLQQDDKLTALVDLDAFVYAPKELEFVLLEYLLNEQQATEFKQYYQQKQQIPDLSAVRAPYRLLFFLMNVLGETDVYLWMNTAKKF